MIKCPKCQASTDESATECPACGIFFSKWKEREENVASGDLSRYSVLATATSSGFNWTILIIVSVVVISIFYYLRFRAE